MFHQPSNYSLFYFTLLKTFIIIKYGQYQDSSESSDLAISSSNIALNLFLRVNESNNHPLYSLLFDKPMIYSENSFLETDY